MNNELPQKNLLKFQKRIRELEKIQWWHYKKKNTHFRFNGMCQYINEWIIISKISVHPPYPRHIKSPVKITHTHSIYKHCIHWWMRLLNRKLRVEQNFFEFSLQLLFERDVKGILWMLLGAYNALNRGGFIKWGHGH